VFVFSIVTFCVFSVFVGISVHVRVNFLV
jgi:hypothetical protein